VLHRARSRVRDCDVVLVESRVRFAYDEVFQGGGTSADLLTSARFPMTDSTSSGDP
jgi:hypothetical protein